MELIYEEYEFATVSWRTRVEFFLDKIYAEWRTSKMFSTGHSGTQIKKGRLKGRGI